MTSFEGDTGPYLQYAHARLCSITRRAGIPTDDTLARDADLSLLMDSPHAIALIRSLAQWPDVFTNTLKTLEPVTVLMYLFKMTHLLSSSYDHLKIVGSEPNLARARFALYECARQVLNEGMTLLGLSPVDRYVLSLSSFPFLFHCFSHTHSLTYTHSLVTVHSVSLFVYVWRHGPNLRPLYVFLHLPSFPSFFLHPSKSPQMPSFFSRDPPPYAECQLT